MINANGYTHSSFPILLVDINAAAFDLVRTRGATDHIGAFDNDLAIIA